MPGDSLSRAMDVTGTRTRVVLDLWAFCGRKLLRVGPTTHCILLNEQNLQDAVETEIFLSRWRFAIGWAPVLCMQIRLDGERGVIDDVE